MLRIAASVAASRWWCRWMRGCRRPSPSPGSTRVLVGGFAALAVLLAALGVYGLLSYTVAQRRGEIAIRMALGAQRGDVLALIVRQGAALVATVAVVGLAVAAASSRVLLRPQSPPAYRPAPGPASPGSIVDPPSPPADAGPPSDRPTATDSATPRPTQSLGRVSRQVDQRHRRHRPRSGTSGQFEKPRVRSPSSASLNHAVYAVGRSASSR